MGDVLNLAIANNISFAAIGAMGAYYTVNWLANEFAQFGIYTYRVERKHEWQYVQIAVICGAVIGLAVTLLSGVIPLAFGIDGEQKAMLASMLVLYIIFQPVKSTAAALGEIARLRGMLSTYRTMIILFYAGSITLNVILFLSWHNIVGIIIAQMTGNFLMAGYGAWKLSREKDVQWGWLSKAQLSCVVKYGAPLVGERLVQRVGLTVYGVCASYLPAELYAVHSICLQAVYMGDIGDSAYSAALLVLVPDKSKNEDSHQRYVSERARMIAYRRKTAWVAILFSFGASYIAAVALHAEASLPMILWFTFFYAFSFIPMALSTPGKDFLTIQKKPVQVMASTMCGVPAYIILPLLAVFIVPPEFALYVFGLTGTVQILVRTVMYTLFIKKTDHENNVDMNEVVAMSRDVVLEESKKAA